MANPFEKLLRAGEGRLRRKLQRVVNAVNDLEESYEKLSDEDLRNETTVLRERHEKGETLDQLMPEAFAAVREAARRTLGMRAYDVQVMGGAALHDGSIAEMKTGEGKTLVATFAAYLNAIPAKGVHVITTNDYLASYQAELMGRIYRALGMSTGIVVSGQTPVVRREQYLADITYGTNNEFGFDYLRDNMAWRKEDLVQRAPFFALVDEVDSILIDEARTPLIISGPSAGEANRWFGEFAKIAKVLEEGVDYEVDLKKRTIGVLEPGIEKVEDHLGVENLYESANTPLISFLNNSIKAIALFNRDQDYVVIDDEVQIVDEHTGRILAGRRYSEGMHQAIEAKENVPVKAENQTLATVTLQNYFRLYEKLAGMTGTAETEAAEFMSTYELSVVPIPTNKPMIRKDQQDVIYRTEAGKFDQLIADIAERHEKGQPVLVGTVSVEKSEKLSSLAEEAGDPSRGPEREEPRARGRGRLGRRSSWRRHRRDQHGRPRYGHHARRQRRVPRGARDAEARARPRGELGGVRGRVGRGLRRRARSASTRRTRRSSRSAACTCSAPSATSHVVSTTSCAVAPDVRATPARAASTSRSTDDLMRLFHSRLADAMTRGTVPDDAQVITGSTSHGADPERPGAGRGAQHRVAQERAEVRRRAEPPAQGDLLGSPRRSSRATTSQSTCSTSWRTRSPRWIRDLTARATTRVGLRRALDRPEVSCTRWTSPSRRSPPRRGTRKGGSTRRASCAEMLSDAKIAYEKREEALGDEAMRELERRVVLSVIDRRWRDHLYEMDYLQARASACASMAQRDPLIEYQREGHLMLRDDDGARSRRRPSATCSTWRFR